MPPGIFDPLATFTLQQGGVRAGVSCRAGRHKERRAPATGTGQGTQAERNGHAPQALRRPRRQQRRSAGRQAAPQPRPAASESFPEADTGRGGAWGRGAARDKGRAGWARGRNTAQPSAGPHTRAGAGPTRPVKLAGAAQQTSSCLTSECICSSSSMRWGSLSTLQLPVTCLPAHPAAECECPGRASAPGLGPPGPYTRCCCAVCGREADDTARAASCTSSMLDAPPNSPSREARCIAPLGPYTLLAPLRLVLIPWSSW